MVTSHLEIRKRPVRLKFLQIPNDLESASLPTYANFKREEAWKARLALVARLLSFSLISIFLVLLFNAHYTDDPIIVVLNYLALYTGFSTLIHHKFFEIPRVLLDVRKTSNSLERPAFFALSPQHREEILEKTLREVGRFPIPKDLADWSQMRIVEELKLEERLPWRKIGKFYFFKFLLITACGGGLVLHSLL